ncbi:MAG: acyl-CoA dehydrogenase, partial [Firmicutes bacterium]|nr:acyl-CoA dehydrogenase [Bacillota bacterium]
IGYTDVYPIEKIVRDLRLSMIWVGTNEIMSLIIQHEYYRERLEDLAAGKKRNSELDALNAFAEGEKIYE